MATTSPDGIISPDSTDPVDFVADWAATAASVQTALSNRATKTGSTAQRTSATGVREGTQWYDTTTQSLWTYLSGIWVESSSGDTGWVYITSDLNSGWTASSLIVRRQGALVSLRGTSVSGTIPSNGGDISPGMDAQFRPSGPAIGIGGSFGGAVQVFQVGVRTSGVINIRPMMGGTSINGNFHLTWMAE